MSTAGDIARGALELLGKGLADKLLGGSKAVDLPTVEAAIKRAVGDALSAATARLEDALRAELQGLGLTLEIRDLGDKPRDTLDLFESKGGMVDRVLEGVQIEYVAPGTLTTTTENVKPIDDSEPKP